MGPLGRRMLLAFILVAVSSVVVLTVAALIGVGQGVEAVQLFDSWAGSLSPAQFERWVIAPNAEIVRRLKALHPDTPVIGFPKGAGGKPVLADHDWDALAANYLGCAAMFHAKWAQNPAGPEPGWGRPLRALRDELQFPVIGARSGKPGERFNSPSDLTQQKLFDLRDKFEALRGATAPRGGD